MSKIITPTIVQGAWDHLEDHFNSRRARKTAPEMELAAQVLQQMGILESEAFLKRFTTTIARTIYTPFEVGNPETHSLRSQLLICAHEHHHVWQFTQDPLKFTFEYGSDSARRAAFEAQAFRCNQEVGFWLTGTVPDPASTAANLEHYGCSQTDILVTEKALRSSALTAKAGGVVNEASQVMIDYLEEHVA